MKVPDDVAHKDQRQRYLDITKTIAVSHRKRLETKLKTTLSKTNDF